MTDRVIVCGTPSRYEHNDHTEDYCPRCEDYGFLQCAVRGRHRWDRRDGRCHDCGVYREVAA